MKLTVKTVIGTAVLCSALLLSACGNNEMKVPETEAETETAIIVDASDVEEASSAKKLLDISTELAASFEDAKTVTSTNEYEDAAKSDVSSIVMNYDGNKRINLDSDCSGKNVAVSISGENGGEFSGVATALRLVKCSGYFKVSGSVETLSVETADAQVDVEGAVANLIISGNGAVVQLTSDFNGSILMLNSEAQLINSSEKDVTVCLSNGAMYNVAAGHTYNMVTGTVAHNIN